MSSRLIDRLRDPDPGARRQACQEVVADPAAALYLEALAEALGDPVKAVAEAASDALATLARSCDIKPVLRSALHRDDATQRLGAALTWARIGPPDPRLLPALVGALGFADGKRRWSAARLLVETGRLHGEVLPLLVGLSRSHDDPVVRRMSRHCLRELGRDDPDAARALLEATRDRDVAARRAGYAALASLLDPPAAVIERLVEALAAEPDGACRRIATVALGQLGEGRPDDLGPTALEALELAARDADDPDLRRGATRALARISG